MDTTAWKTTLPPSSSASGVANPRNAATRDISTSESNPLADRYAAWSCVLAVAALAAPMWVETSAARVTSPAALPAGTRIIMAYAVADERTHVAAGTLPKCAPRIARSDTTSAPSCTSSSASTTGSHGPACTSTSQTRPGPTLRTR